jgi:hypothetical protein
VPIVLLIRPNFQILRSEVGERRGPQEVNMEQEIQVPDSELEVGRGMPGTWLPLNTPPVVMPTQLEAWLDRVRIAAIRDKSTRFTAEPGIAKAEL